VLGGHQARTVTKSLTSPGVRSTVPVAA
jgi:hypothetical protein